MSADPWFDDSAGLVILPSGRRVRGRAIRHPTGTQLPTFSVYLVGKEPSPAEWESRWIKWRDFWLPSDPVEAKRILRDAWERAATERVEVACGGGRGRTGTALACMAVLDGVAPHEAVQFVRYNYDKRAVETPWQRRFVERFAK